MPISIQTQIPDIDEFSFHHSGSRYMTNTMPQSEANPKVFSGRKRKKGDIAEISEAKRSWGNPDGHISMDTAEMETLKKRCSQQADYVKHLHGQIEKKDKEARHWLQRFTKACEVSMHVPMHGRC